jgi:hypothetical protein
VILDHEEGAGNQAARADAWFHVVDDHYRFRATLYAGLSFCNTNLGGWNRWRGRPRWMAAYQKTEPRDPHELWQHTDNARFPGIPGGVDGNLFHGTDSQFAAVFARGAAGGPARPAPPQPDIADLAATTLIQNKDGRLEEFVFSKGQIFHRWQEKPNGNWGDGWASLGSP